MMAGKEYDGAIMNKKYLTPDEAENAFYDALGCNDLDAMMGIWLENDDTVCVHPGACRLEGTVDIRMGFEQMFEQPTTEMDFTVSDKRCQRLGNVAIHTLREEIEIGGQLVSVMLATNIYQQTEDGWRMLLHHASPELDFDMDDLDLTMEHTTPVVLH